MTSSAGRGSETPSLSEDTNSSMPFFFSCKSRQSVSEADNLCESVCEWAWESYIQLVDVNVSCRNAKRRRYTFPKPPKKTDVQPPHIHSKVLKGRGAEWERGGSKIKHGGRRGPASSLKLFFWLVLFLVCFFSFFHCVVYVLRCVVPSCILIGREDTWSMDLKCDKWYKQGSIFHLTDRTNGSIILASTRHISQTLGLQLAPT